MSRHRPDYLTGKRKNGHLDWQEVDETRRRRKKLNLFLNEREMKMLRCLARQEADEIEEPVNASRFLRGLIRREYAERGRE